MSVLRSGRARAAAAAAALLALLVPTATGRSTRASPGTGNGGTCYGDSGGPHFAPDGTIVSITTTGDLPCKAIDQTYRVDTTIARDFLTTVGVHFHD